MLESVCAIHIAQLGKQRHVWEGESKKENVRHKMEWAQKKPIVGTGSKYGLQLKIAAPAAKKAPFKKPQSFAVDDEDEFSVEDDIARQASKKQSAHEADLQIKQALEQDSSAFAYDDIYDEMKGKEAQPIREDRAKREPKYIGRLIEKAKARAVDQDIAFERRLKKEREKDDHLYGDKETFVTGAYKKKLIEMGKWQEEERRRDEREKAHEVTGKRDLSDFYRNLLQNNVAFGGKGSERDSTIPKRESQAGVPGPEVTSGTSAGQVRQSFGADNDDLEARVVDKTHGRQNTIQGDSDSRSSAEDSPSRDLREESKDDLTPAASGSVTRDNASSSLEENGKKTFVSTADGQGSDARKEASKEDAVAAARERYLARKRQRKD